MPVLWVPYRCTYSMVMIYVVENIINCLLTSKNVNLLDRRKLKSNFASKILHKEVMRQINKKHPFLGIFLKGRQTRKRCFLNKEYCFLVIFPKGGRTRKHCCLVMFFNIGQTRKRCFLATFSKGRQTRKLFVSWFVYLRVF